MLIMKERGVLDDESGKWMMKGRLSMTNVGFRAHVKTAPRIVS